MQSISSKVLLDGKSVDFMTANLKRQGGNTATAFNFILPKDDASFRKYWNKEVLFYVNESDAYPMFRGRVSDVILVGERQVEFQCVDALGYLTGHYKAGHKFDPEDIRSKDLINVWQGDNFDNIYKVTEKLRNWAEDHGRDIIQLAIAWVLANKSVTTVIVGARKPNQVYHNIKALDWKLTKNDLNEIEEILDGFILPQDRW